MVGRSRIIKWAKQFARSKFARDQNGNVAMIFAAASVGLFGAAGAAYDFSNSHRYTSQAQNVLDAAVIAGILDADKKNEQIKIAKDFYFSNLPNQYPLNAKVTFSHDGDGTLVAKLTGHIETTLLKIVGVPNISIEALSKARRGANFKAPMCFMAMHPTRKHTLELKGSVSVYAPQCHIYGNSNHPYDVVDPHTSKNFLTTASIQAIGFGHHFINNLTPPLEYAPELIADPFASLALPVAGPCDYDEKKIEGGNVTIYPGTYCKGLEIKKNATVTMKPGLYIIDDEKFKIEDSMLLGTGVTIMLTDGAEIEWKESVIRLSAQLSGPYTSFVLMGERKNEDHEFKDSTVDLHGVVYLPEGEFVWENKGTPAISADWTVWIIDGVSWIGDGVININFDTDSGDVPYPDGLKIIPRPGGDDSVRLIN